MPPCPECKSGNVRLCSSDDVKWGEIIHTFTCRDCGNSYCVPETAALDFIPEAIIDIMDFMDDGR